LEGPSARASIVTRATILGHSKDSLDDRMLNAIGKRDIGDHPLRDTVFLHPPPQ
jgi:hypothetical protein